MIYKRLGAMLVDAGQITDEQLNTALEIQKTNPGKRIDEILVERGFITQRAVYKMLERQLGVKFIDLTNEDLDRDLIRLVPLNMAKKYNIVPVSVEDDTLFLAMADPLNFLATDAVHLCPAGQRQLRPLRCGGRYAGPPWRRRLYPGRSGQLPDLQQGLQHAGLPDHHAAELGHHGPGRCRARLQAPG